MDTLHNNINSEYLKTLQQESDQWECGKVNFVIEWEKSVNLLLANKITAFCKARYPAKSCLLDYVWNAKLLRLPQGRKGHQLCVFIP